MNLQNFALILFFLGILSTESCKVRNNSAKTASADQRTPTVSVEKLKMNMSNSDSFSDKIAAVESAKASIDAAYYIYKDDFTGSVFTSALVDAAKRGVKVRLLVDEQTVLFHKSLFIAAKRKATELNIANDQFRIAYYRPVRLPPSLQQMQGVINDAIEDAFALRDQRVSAEWLDPTTEHNIFKLILNPAYEQLQKQLLDPQHPLSMADAGTYVKNFIKKASGASSPEEFAQTILEPAVGRPVTQEEAKVLLNVSHRLHHKLLVVDGQEVFGGGRNMWDISNMEHEHPLRLDPIGKTDMDFDYHVASSQLATTARMTLDTMWGCLQVTPCTYTLLEEDGSDRAISSKKDPRSPAEEWEYVAKQSSTWKAQQAAPAGYDPTFPKEPLTIQHARIRYIEHLDNNKDPNEFLTNWRQLIENLVANPEKTPEGERSIVIQNAYLILPPTLYTDIAQAIKAGIPVTLITNAEEISDNTMISVFGRMQVEALMNFAAANGKPDLVTYIENSSAQQMHTKAAIIGSTLVMGSANADPRSAFLNTENGIVVEPEGSQGVVWNGQTFQNPGLAYRTILMQTLDKGMQRTIKDRFGKERVAFRKVTLSQIKTAFAALPPTTAPTTPNEAAARAKAYLSYFMNSFLRSQFKAAISEDANAETARKIILEQILLQF